MVVSVGMKEAWANLIEKDWKTFKKIFQIKNGRKKRRGKKCCSVLSGVKFRPFLCHMLPRCSVSENLIFLLKGNFLSEHLLRLLAKLVLCLLSLCATKRWPYSYKNPKMSLSNYIFHTMFALINLIINLSQTDRQ